MLYCIINVIYGVLFDSLGPLVPYFSEATNLSESNFSIIFIMRGIGYIGGGFIKLIFMSKLDLHQGMRLSMICAGVGIILFVHTLDRFWMSVWALEFNFSLSIFEIFMNISFMNLG